MRVGRRVLRRMTTCASCAGPKGLASLGPKGSSAQEAVQQLRKDVVAVGKLPFVTWVDPPVLYPIAEQDEELFRPQNDTGPWLVRLRMEAGVLAHVKVNAGYPDTPAELRIVAQYAAPVLDESGCLKSARRGLVSSVSALHDTLSGLDPKLNPKLSVCSKYRPLRCHAELFEDVGECGWVSPSSLDPLLLQALRTGGIRGVVREDFAEVYSFPLFAPSFCAKVCEEYDRFLRSGIESRRPNSMNRYGLVLNEMGMEAALGRLQREILLPIASQFFGRAQGAHFDAHHSFIVRYKMGEDLGLDMHTDDSDVTFNVCLSADFTGSGLQFCGNMGATAHRKATGNYKHELGRCVMHLGRRRHGADDISSGERVNLVMWNNNSEFRRSSEYNNPSYVPEQSAPDPVCVSYTHDRDYGKFKPYPSAAAERFRGRGWCPPVFAEYEDFEEEDAVAGTGNSSEGSTPPD